MDAVKSDAIDKRLRLIERKLDERDRVPDCMAVNSNVTAMENRLNVDDKMVLVKNLSFGMQDEGDANKLVRDGLGLNIKIQSSDENYVMHNEMLDRKFTLQEIDGAIKHLKSGKAAGSDDIRNEYISYENKQLKPILQLLFNEIYNTGIYPAQRSSGIIVPIYKKGNKEDPSNYRGITLTSAMSKLFTHMVNQRISDWSEESGILSQAQFAYKKGYNTTDAIFVLNTTLSFCIETFKHSCCGFIDFSKAFDTIDRETLYGKLKQCNISSKFLSLIKNMYSQLLPS